MVKFCTTVAVFESAADISHTTYSLCSCDKKSIFFMMFLGLQEIELQNPIDFYKAR